MTDYSAARAKHATLGVGVADKVTLGANWPHVEVLNRSASGAIYFNVNSSSNPAVGGDDTYVVMPQAGVTVDTPSPTPTVVRVICSSANDYSVSGF